MKTIRFDRPLPLLVDAEGFIYDLRLELDESIRQWRVAAFRFDEGFVGWVTYGRNSFPELQQALVDGIEIADDQPFADVIVSELVNEGRATFLETATAA
jgi:hypothetical protein